MDGMTASTPRDIILRPKGISIRNSKNAFVINNYLENTFNAFEIVGSDEIYFEGNIANYLISDMFHCTKVKRLTIKYNYRGKGLAYQLAKDHRYYIRADRERVSYDGKIHSDFVQIFSEIQDRIISENINICSNSDACCIIQDAIGDNNDWNNFCQNAFPLVSQQRASNHAVGLQGIFIRSENNLRHKNITIEENHIYNTQHNPYKAINANNIRIVKNYCTKGLNFNTSSNTPITPNIEGVTNIIRANGDAYVNDNHVIIDGQNFPIDIVYQ